MGTLLTVVFLGCASPCVYADPELSADPADLIEHGSAEEAQAFGWGALPGATLAAVNEGHIGGHALRAEPGPEPKEYMGIDLRHVIDLTGAGAGDRIIFFVKQNFGTDLVINLHAERGNAHRAVRVKQGQWTRVEVDLRLANWDQDAGSRIDAWTQVDYLHIYSKGFDQSGEYMLLDGFAVFVGGSLS